MNSSAKCVATDAFFLFFRHILSSQRELRVGKIEAQLCGSECGKENPNSKDSDPNLRSPPVLYLFSSVQGMDFPPTSFANEGDDGE